MMRAKILADRVQAAALPAIPAPMTATRIRKPLRCAGDTEWRFPGFKSAAVTWERGQDGRNRGKPHEIFVRFAVGGPADRVPRPVK
jgi:hypothetical protein